MTVKVILIDSAICMLTDFFSFRIKSIREDKHIEKDKQGKVVV